MASLETCVSVDNECVCIDGCKGCIFVKKTNPTSVRTKKHMVKYMLIFEKMMPIYRTWKIMNLKSRSSYIIFVSFIRIFSVKCYALFSVFLFYCFILHLPWSWCFLLQRCLLCAFNFHAAINKTSDNWPCEKFVFSGHGWNGNPLYKRWNTYYSNKVNHFFLILFRVMVLFICLLFPLSI